MMGGCAMQIKSQVVARVGLQSTIKAVDSGVFIAIFATMTYANDAISRGQKLW